MFYTRMYAFFFNVQFDYRHKISKTPPRYCFNRFLGCLRLFAGPIPFDKKYIYSLNQLIINKFLYDKYLSLLNDYLYHFVSEIRTALFVGFQKTRRKKIQIRTKT